MKIKRPANQNRISNGTVSNRNIFSKLGRVLGFRKKHRQRMVRDPQEKK